MPFIPRLPTWNVTVEVYRVKDGVTGATLRGSLTGQLYNAHKRAAGPSKELDLAFLYPKGGSLVLHAKEQLAGSDEDSGWQRDMLAFPWDQGVHGDMQHVEVVETAPRLYGFPNEHNIALLAMLPYGVCISWFTTGGPPPPPVGGGIHLDGPPDGTCDACDEVGGDVPMPSTGSHVWESAAISWSCPGVDVVWRFNFVPSSGVTILTLFDPAAGTIYAQYLGSDPTWDEASNTTVYLSVSDPDTTCGWPSSVVFGPP